MLADEITDDEESQHLGQAVTDDILPHTFYRALAKEGIHLGIGLCITEPRGEIGLVDALSTCLCPPRIVERLREINTAELCHGIEEDGGL